jgi:uncharacterized protein (DUF305 family)
MNTQMIVVGITAALVGGIIGYALPGSWHGYGPSLHTKDYTRDSIPRGTHRMPDGSLMHDTGPTMGKGDMNGMDHMMAMMVSSEREFITSMIPHHQEAVDTAKEVIARGGTTPEIKTLVENIVVTQEQEIAQMKQWHQEWYGEAYTDTGTYMPMMQDLSQLSGAALDRAFLEDMIPHHMGAIMMAHSVEPYITHSEIETLTQAIISTQSDEIRLMRQMLASL